MKKLTLIVALAMSTVDSVTVNAQSTQKGRPQHPWTLVYEGAITENVKGKVNIHPVTYELNGITIADNVYTPPNYDASKKYPAITVAHPNGGVKEQTAGTYAQILAEAVYKTIVDEQEWKSV